jgi:L-ascorbate 6-phosphate lactonase
MASTLGASALALRIAERDVPSGQVVTWWLGGSGFVFKTPGNVQVWIDPYLSDVARTVFGLGRAFPPPITAEEARPDAVIATHWHEDHLDPGTIPVLARRCPKARFIMPPSAMARALSWGMMREQVTPLTVGRSTQVGDVKVTAVPARHEAGVPGWEVPDAMGVVLEVAGLKIYHTGDTEYDLRLRALKSHKVDVFLGCINGVGGNMNAHEAALLAWQLGVSVAIPMHHLLWDHNPGGDEATLDPQLFAGTYKKLGGIGRVVLPEIGCEIPLNGR